ncbi:hypothetical protein [Paraburkholderia rhizosphaerae]|uniref:Uncharacterized protein n=1 Tax=Paraburkholderia rhizosphaerae TaxID=480658 RepID=A0A4R8L546_9BURK|nr:hypothetical protein [Paraburkholderia rhizosphaerae]TDY37752.1 hypothetical protein BX592_13512 [Paraburkholderia rhizosphaerae]
MGIHIGEAGGGYHDTPVYHGEQGPSNSNHGQTGSSDRLGTAQTSILSNVHSAGGATRNGLNRTRNSTRGAPTSGAALPERYIAKPDGELRSDPGNMGIFIDRKGQQYLQNDGKWYGVSRDNANGTWRLAQQGDPAKPGIPVDLGANGSWTIHDDVGLKGGMLSGDPAKAQGIAEAQRKVDDLTREHQALTGEQDRLTREINDAHAAALGYRTKADDARRGLADATRRADQARREMETTQRVLDNPSQASDDAKRAAQVARDQLRTAESDAQREQYKLDEAERNVAETHGRIDTRRGELSAVLRRLDAVVADQFRADARLSRLQRE